MTLTKSNQIVQFISAEFILASEPSFSFLLIQSVLLVKWLFLTHAKQEGQDRGDVLVADPRKFQRKILARLYCYPINYLLPGTTPWIFISSSNLNSWEDLNSRKSNSDILLELSRLIHSAKRRSLTVKGQRCRHCWELLNIPSDLFILWILQWNNIIQMWRCKCTMNMQRCKPSDNFCLDCVSH